MNYVGIDPSLISTAMVVNGKLFNYCREADAKTKKGEWTKWFGYCADLVEFKFIEYQVFDDYLTGEINKLRDYDRIADQIISDILTEIEPGSKTIVGIEGYSYASQAGDIIDLVTFSTLLRKKLNDHVTKEILILAPTTLKLEACKLTYEPLDIGKKKPKLEWRNHQGLAGGGFKKPEMLLALVENPRTDDAWINHLRQYQDELLEPKTVKKPYEDLNDAYLLYLYLKSKF